MKTGVKLESRQSVTIFDHLDILACPDCGGDVSAVDAASGKSWLYCSTCNVAFPVLDGVPVLLPASARNYKLEYDFLKDISSEASTGDQKLGRILENTIAMVKARKDNKSWEWEDETFWNAEYLQEVNSGVPKNWQDRIWQREKLVEKLVTQIDLRQKSILDIGCGEGQNFRFLLADRCDDSTLYIATDISLAGLKLNRSRNPHANSLYILCTADAPPFKPESIDILCYFGILHHTEKKEKVLEINKSLLKTNGLIALHEPLIRPSPWFVPQITPVEVESAHEERIDLVRLETEIRTAGYSILYSRKDNTVFYTAMLMGMPGFSLSSRPVFSIISFIDRFLYLMLGRLIVWFRAGSILLLLRKK